MRLVIVGFLMQLRFFIFSQEVLVTCDGVFYDFVVDDICNGPGIIRGDLMISGAIENEDLWKPFCVEQWSDYSVVRFGDDKFLQVLFEQESNDPKLATYYYTENGQIAMVVPFLRGKIHGVVYTYHIDGDCLTIMRFKRGRFRGYSFYWGEKNRRRLNIINSNVEGNPLLGTTVIR